MQTSSVDDRPFVLILHAYSPSNSGDGLLVQLALDAIERSLGEFDYAVVASDAAGFGGREPIQWGWPQPLARSRWRRASMVVATALRRPGRVAKAAAEADLIVAVGGAYLRGGDRIESFKSWGAHYGQLSVAARHGHKAVYLPQSIGPYHGLYERATVAKLSQIGTVFVRDDRTLADLEGRVNVRRVPDMAIMEWGRTFTPPRPLSTLSPVFVARDLPRPRTYYDLLSDISNSGEFEWAIQATGSGNNDIPVTTRFGGPSARPLTEVLSQDPPRIVVSTRLHGSLSSIIAGFPSIHLTYERKGWSAFQDLGLSRFVISARDARLDDIKRLVDEITAEPEHYWQEVAEARSRIEDSRTLMESAISATANESRARSSR